MTVAAMGLLPISPNFSTSVLPQRLAHVDSPVNTRVAKRPVCLPLELHLQTKLEHR
jgi:hypothetical protein